MFHLLVCNSFPLVVKPNAVYPDVNVTNQDKRGCLKVDKKVLQDTRMFVNVECGCEATNCANQLNNTDD